MIYAITRMTIPSQKVEEAVKILSSVTQRCRCQPGCISSNVYQDAEQNNAIMLQQAWRDEKDLEDHLRSAEYRNVLLVAEMALASPEIRFDTVARTTGIETVERARTTPGERTN